MFKCSVSQRKNLGGNKQFCDLGKTFVYMFKKKEEKKSESQSEQEDWNKISIYNCCTEWSCDPMEKMQKDNVIKH